MVVKMICGTYGYRPNPNEMRVIRKDSKSPAFELDDAEAERLIGLGVAQAVAISQEINGGDEDFSAISKEKIMSMEFNDMRKLAKSYGLDTKGTGEELRKRLIEAFVKEDEQAPDEQDDDMDGGIEQPPELNAQDPV